MRNQPAPPITVKPARNASLSLRFMADVLHKLHREPNSRFSGKELERFLKEDWYLLKGKRLIQRNDRMLKRKRAKAAQNVPATKIAKILLSRKTDPPARH
jgi:hypothetical protein